MNIYNIFIIFLLFSIVSCISDNQNRKTDIERLQLNGQINSYLKTIHRSSNELNDTIKSKFKEQYRELILFDKNGNIIKEISFKKNGERYKKWISVYYKKGDEIEKFEIKYPNDTLKRWLNKYDNSGNEIESLIYDHRDSILSHTKSEYNKFNKKTETIILKSKKAKSLLVKVSYSYDNDGNQTKRTNHFKDKSIEEWFTEYDPIGNETEWRVYDRQGNFERKDTYIYDNNSNLLEERLFNSDNILESSQISEYDLNGKEIKYTEYLYDSISAYEEYTYNGFGNKTTKHFNSKGKLLFTTQLISEIDINGNLIKRSKFRNGNLTFITAYKIEYYK